ncbi:MAG TPA: phosphoribosyltransferase family protein [Candidatus Paceibacterota bacterium]
MDNEVIEILTRVGGILPNSHFVGTSGLHFDTYVNKDCLYPHTKETSRIGRIFADKFKDADIQVVVGPALGGIIISQWTAYYLSEIHKMEILGVFTEKTPEGGQKITRGYDKYVKNKKVLVVEDIVTTGGSMAKTVKAVQDAGGNVVAACAMINKYENMGSEVLGVPFFALADLFVPTYGSEQCPICKAGIPIDTTVGHGKKFLESQI